MHFKKDLFLHVSVQTPYSFFKGFSYGVCSMVTGPQLNLNSLSHNTWPDPAVINITIL